MRAVGPSFQSPDVPTVASASGLGRLSRPGGCLGLWRDYKLPTLAQTTQHWEHTTRVYVHLHTPPPSVRGQTPAPGSTHTVSPGVAVCQGCVPHRALPRGTSAPLPSALSGSAIKPCLLDATNRFPVLKERAGVAPKQTEWPCAPAPSGPA